MTINCTPTPFNRQQKFQFELQSHLQLNAVDDDVVWLLLLEVLFLIRR